MRRFMIVLAAGMILATGLTAVMLLQKEARADVSCESTCHSRCMGRVNYNMCIQNCKARLCFE